MYLIFGGETHYASGGAYDLLGNYDDESKAVKRSKELIGRRAITKRLEDDDLDWEEGFNIEWTHVYCLDRRKIIHREGAFPLSGGKVVVYIAVVRDGVEEPTVESAMDEVDL